MDYILYFNKPIICTFIRRYKRFFSEFSYNNEIITAHCANTGAMQDILIQNNKCILSSKSSGKLLYTFEAIDNHGTWVGTNTMNPNRIIKSYLPYLFPNQIFTPEVQFPGTRVDFASDNIIIEVKHVHWLPKDNNIILPNIDNIRQNSTFLSHLSTNYAIEQSYKKNIAFFPDSVTIRGNKQLLAFKKIKGFTKYIIFILQRNDIDKISIAQHIDPRYYEELLNNILYHDLRIMCFSCDIDQNGIQIYKQIQFII